jgi:hypothetical protein
MSRANDNESSPPSFFLQILLLVGQQDSVIIERWEKREKENGENSEFR